MLGRESERLLDVIMVSWAVLGIIIGHVLNMLDVSAYWCSVCHELAKYIPSINSYTLGSKYPDVMHYVVIYYMTTSPLILFILVKTISVKSSGYARSNKKDMYKWGVLFVISLFFTLLVDYEFGGEDAKTRFQNLYRDNLTVSIVGVGCSWYIMVVSLFYLHVHLSAQFDKVK